MNRICLSLAVAGYLIATCITPIQAESWIVEKGQARAEIIIAEHPSRSVRLAAAELQEYVQKISGARLPIVALGQVHFLARIDRQIEQFPYSDCRGYYCLTWRVTIGT